MPKISLAVFAPARKKCPLVSRRRRFSVQRPLPPLPDPLDQERLARQIPRTPQTYSHQGASLCLLFKPAGNIPHLPLGRARRRGSLALPLCCFIQSAGPSSPQLLLFALRIPSILSRRVALRLQQVASTPRPSHTSLSRAPLHVSACLSTPPPFQSFPPLL